MKGSLIIQVLSALQRFNRSIIKLLRRWRLNGDFGVLLVAQGRLLAASGHGRLFKVWALRADLKSFGSNPPNSWEGSVKQIWCQICPEYVKTFRFWEERVRLFALTFLLKPAGRRSPPRATPELIPPLPFVKPVVIEDDVLPFQISAFGS